MHWTRPGMALIIARFCSLVSALSRYRAALTCLHGIESFARLRYGARLSGPFSVSASDAVCARLCPCGSHLGWLGHLSESLLVGSGVAL